MFVVRVVPMTPLPPAVPQVLDCLYGSQLPRGSIVRAPLGRRSVVAVVLSSSDASRAKLALKRASYGLKPLSAVICPTPQASEAQLLLASWIAHYYASGPATAAHAVFPAWLGRPRRLLDVPPAPEASKPPVTVAVTSPDSSVALIASALKRGRGQVLVIVPERTVLSALSARLAGHEPVIVHSGLGILREHTIHSAVADGSTRFVIGTRSALFLPWHNLRHVIVEDANNDAYKSDAAPRTFAPDVARKLAELHGASLTLMVPALSAVQRRMTAAGSAELISSKPLWPRILMLPAQPLAGVLSPESEDAIDRTLAQQGRVLVVSPRRAWSGSLRCRACRKAVPCPTCLIPLRVHEPSPTERMLVCYHCGACENLPRLCPSCGHGPLAPAGLAGSQRIASAVRRLLERRAIEGVSVSVFDTDLLRTAQQQESAAAAFADAPSCVVVASQLILPYRWRMRFDLVVVAEADAFAWHPDFRSHERLIWQLEKLADFGPASMLIQHIDGGGALAHAPSRSWEQFLDGELTARKTLRWPPFVRLASVTVRNGSRAMAQRGAALVSDRLRRAAAHLGIAKRVIVSEPMPSLTRRAGGTWSCTVLVKTDADAARLTELLAHVPTGVVDVDPRSIL